MIKLSSIKPNPNNPRIIRNEKFEKLKQSIEEFPQMMELRPIVVDETNTIIGGNMRFRALQELGKKEVPNNWIKKASELTEDQKKRFVITDNASFGEWEWGAIKSDWDLNFVADWGVDVPEFESEKVEAKEYDYEIPNEIKTDIVLGDLFEIGEHRLLCGDSTDSDVVDMLMDNKRADMVFLDPPYGVSYASKNKYLNSISPGNRIQKPIENDHMNLEDTENFIFLLFLQVKRILADRSSYYITAPQGGDLMMMMMMMMKAGIPLRHCLIWVKNNHVLGRTDYNYKHEPILYGWNNVHDFYGNGKHRFSTWEIPKPTKNDLHPTMKPVALVENAMLNSTLMGMIIADLCMGSGTTMVAAHQLKRKCYGMEIDPKYCSVILNRMLKLDPSLKVLKNGKPYINPGR